MLAYATSADLIPTGKLSKLFYWEFTKYYKPPIKKIALIIYTFDTFLGLVRQLVTLFLWRMRCSEAVIIIKMSKYEKVYLASMIIVSWCRLVTFLEFARENFWYCASQIYHSIYDPQPSRFLTPVATKSNLDSQFTFYKRRMVVEQWNLSTFLKNFYLYNN